MSALKMVWYAVQDWREEHPSIDFGLDVAILLAAILGVLALIVPSVHLFTAFLGTCFILLIIFLAIDFFTGYKLF